MKKILILILALSGSAALAANDDIIKADQAYKKALQDLEQVEKDAFVVIQNNGDLESEFKTKIAVSLFESNMAYKKFLEQDCLNEAYQFGSVGGSALGLDLLECETKLINSRIATLKDRFELK